MQTNTHTHTHIHRKCTQSTCHFKKLPPGFILPPETTRKSDKLYKNNSFQDHGHQAGQRFLRHRKQTGDLYSFPSLLPSDISSCGRTEGEPGGTQQTPRVEETLLRAGRPRQLEFPRKQYPRGKGYPEKNGRARRRTPPEMTQYSVAGQSVQASEETIWGQETNLAGKLKRAAQTSHRVGNVTVPTSQAEKSRSSQGTEKHSQERLASMAGNRWPSATACSGAASQP